MDDSHVEPEAGLTGAEVSEKRHSLPVVDLGIPGYDEAVEIGRGGFATVYRARRRSFGDSVAIKVIDTLPDEQTLRRVDRELHAVGKVAGHRNVVAVHHTDRRPLDGRPYIVMELVPGGTLAEWVSRRGPLPWEEVIDIGIVLAAALQWAHDRGVIHRDLKPENILVDDRFTDTRDRIRLSDFGLAAIEGRMSTSHGWSVAHVAPEVILDSAAPSIKADLYGLASTLFQLLDGEAPFVKEEDETLAQVFARLQAGTIPDLRLKGVPDPLAAVIEQGLQRDPDQRPDSAAEFAALLGAAAEEVAEAARAAEAARTAEAAATVAGTGLTTTRRQRVSAVRRGFGARLSQLSMTGLAMVIAAVMLSGAASIYVLTGLLSGTADEEQPAMSSATPPPSTTLSATTMTTLAPGHVFSDDFSQNRGWTLTNDASVRSAVEDGHYQVVAKLSRSSFRVAAPQDASTAAGNRTRVEVDATLVTPGASGLAGVTCRASGPSYYYGQVGADGYWRIARSGSVPLPFFSRTATAATRIRELDPAAPIRIGMECSGGTSVSVKLFVNGQLVATASDDSGFAEGQVGLLLTADTPGEWHFDNFEVNRF